MCHLGCVANRWAQGSARHRDPAPTRRASGPRRRHTVVGLPRVRSPAPSASPWAHSSPPGSEGALHVWSYRPCAAQLRGVPVRPGSIDGPVRSAASQCSQMRWHVTRGERTRPYWPWRAGQREGEAPPVGSDAAEGWRTARRRSLSASHRAADGAGPSIEPARTYAHGISTGPAVAVSCAWPRWETAAGLVCAVWRAVTQSANQSVSKSCCAWARRAGSAQCTVPSALPGSIITLGTFSHPPDALTCRPQRGRAASTGRGGAPEAVKTQFWPAVMAPRRSGLSADDAAASHRAVDGAVPSIDAARTRAHGTTRGAVAVSRASCPRIPAIPSTFRVWPRPLMRDLTGCIRKQTAA
jgi:hypothetical protein